MLIAFLINGCPYFFISGAGPYKSLEENDRLIALEERVEEQVSTEHENWFSEAQKTIKDEKKKVG